MGISVSIADEADLTVTGIQAVLSNQPDLQVVSTCRSLADLVFSLEKRCPEILLLSNRLEPDMDGITLVEQIHRTAPRMKQIILSNQSDGLLVHELFAAGISAFLYKGDPLSYYLPEAVQAVLRNKPYLSPTANAEYLIAVQSGQNDWRMDGEARTVLHLLTQGYRPQENALMRGVSVRRVYWVNNKLRRRFGAETNEHLIARAAEEGFLA